MTQQCDQHASDKERILKVVIILKLWRSNGPWINLLIRLVGVEPYIPFIEAEIHRFLAAFLGFDVVTGCCNCMNEMIHVHRSGQVICRISIPVAIVLVQGDIVGNLIGMIKCNRFPFREGRHCRIGASTGYQLDIRVYETHCLGGLIG
ncbi:hypothetical protein D3C78_1329190 [compost metagenome]